MPIPMDLVTSVESLHALIGLSVTTPVLIVKHSLTCGVSAFAHEEIERFAASLDTGLTIGVIHIQTHREVSNAATTVLGIRHESPQVLLVKDSQVVWHASHYRITSETLLDAVMPLREGARQGQESV